MTRTDSLLSEPDSQRPFGLYVHIPFCPQRCPYCAFAIVTGHGDTHERYVEALCSELALAVGSSGPSRPVDTIFLGGGTPSQLEAGQLDRILSSAASIYGISDGAEITIEVNPGEDDRVRYADFRKIGINRISIGAQSFCDPTLKRLGRQHSSKDALLAFARAMDGGFENISLDLIFSVPDVPEAEWSASLRAAIDLGPQHISTYGLTIEEGTLFHSRAKAGRLVALCEDADARQYRQAIDMLEDAGYAQYEVSNFSRQGYHSRHNWGYWTGAEYLGVGLSAHSFADGVRSWNLKKLGAYLERVESGRSPRAGEEQIDSSTARREAVWLGLRTWRGVELSEDEELTLMGQSRFRAFLDDALMEKSGQCLKITGAGFPIADALGTEVITMLETDEIRSESPARERAVVIG